MMKHGSAPDLDELSPSSAEVFPASRSLVRALVEGKMTPGTCGLNLGESLAKLDPDGCWEKTCQGSEAYVQMTLDGSSEPFSETWPRSGIVLDGSAYELRMSERRTDESGCSLWATPRAGNPGSRKPGTGGKILAEEAKRVWTTPHGEEKSPGPNGGHLTSQVKQEQTWPTPAERDFRTGMPGRIAAEMGKPGQLNPAWVECLMGFPEGWTVLDGPEDSKE